jgi:hypothetical protein
MAKGFGEYSALALTRTELSWLIRQRRPRNTPYTIDPSEDEVSINAAIVLRERDEARNDSLPDPLRRTPVNCRF